MNDFDPYKKPEYDAFDPKPLKSHNNNVNNDNDFPDSAHETVYNTSDLSLSGSFEEDNRVLEIGKGIIGALIGAIPGIILWILIGRFGFIATISGAILAGGTILGYRFTQKNDVLSTRTGIIICVCVIIFGIHIAQKIIWCMDFSLMFDNYVAQTKETLYGLGEMYGMENDEIDRMFKETMLEEFGFTEGTFSNFYSNFYKVLKALDGVGKYIGSLILSVCFAGAGSFAVWRRYFQN